MEAAGGLFVVAIIFGTVVVLALIQRRRVDFEETRRRLELGRRQYEAQQQLEAVQALEDLKIVLEPAGPNTSGPLTAAEAVAVARREQAHPPFKAMNEAFGRQLEQIVREHAPILVRKFVKAVKQGDYGEVRIDPSWDKEVRYFVRNVVVTDPRMIALARREAAKAEPAELLNAKFRIKTFDTAVKQQVVRLAHEVLQGANLRDGSINGTAEEVHDDVARLGPPDPARDRTFQ